MHHALQLSVDEHLRFDNGEYTIWHNGRIAVGNRGSGKISDLKNSILAESPALITNGQIILGTLLSDNLLYVDNTSVGQFICNLIRYALIRDKFRGIVKNGCV